VCVCIDIDIPQHIANNYSHLHLIFLCYLIFSEHRSPVNTRWAPCLSYRRQSFLAYRWLEPKRWPLPGMWWTLWRRTRCAGLRPPRLSAPWPSSRGPHSSTPPGGANNVQLSILKRKEGKTCLSAITFVVLVNTCKNYTQLLSVNNVTISLFWLFGYFAVWVHSHSSQL